MDLSINNNGINKKNISFKGLMGEYNKETLPVYKFIAPAHKKNEKVVLELAMLYKNEKTAQYFPPHHDDFIELPFNEQDDTLEENND